jgi:hypothetical protein
MTTVEVRSELKDLIDRIRDLSVLEALRTLALRQAEQDELSADMERVADLSDEDIAAGRTHSIDDVKRWMDEQKRDR